MSLSQSATSISIIIPLHNEEKRVMRCKERLISYCEKKEWDFEIIFAQDNSTDNTASIINEFSLSDSRIKALNIQTCAGKGGAIMSTVPLSTKKYLAYMDVDLAAGPPELVRLFEYINNYDIIIGSRILRDDLLPVKRRLYRSLLSYSYSALFRRLFRVSIRDAQCGLKLFRKDLVSKLFDDTIVMDFAFDTDMIVTAFSQGLTVKEVPVNWTDGKNSKISIVEEISAMGIDIFSIWYRFHLLWKQGKKTYPQKKGSIFGRILFNLLSLSKEIKRTQSKYLDKKRALENEIKHKMNISNCISVA